MKSTILLFISVCFTMILQAQVSKTVNVTAGNLKTVLTTDELKTVTNLTLTGIINESDFSTMRNDMPALAVLDISGVSVNGNKIPPNSFSQKGTLIKILLPSSVTSIGEYAFTGCTGLTSVTIPSSVTSIGNCAFQGCCGLTSVTIPSSVTSIGVFAFDECRGLTSVTIPSSVTYIYIGAFKGCSGLTSVSIPSSVTSVGDWAFYGCYGLTSVSIPSSVTSIGEEAFYGCGCAFTVDSNNLNYSSNDGVLYDKGQTTLIKCPKSKTASFIIPSSVCSIDNEAFSGCSLLTSVTIPPSVTSIGDWAFSGCSGLTSVNIPSSITSIGEEAFRGCTGLTTIFSNSIYPIDLRIPPWYSTVFDGINKDNCTLYVPIGSKELYASADQWKDFVNIVENPWYIISSHLIFFWSQMKAVQLLQIFLRILIGY